MFKGRKILPGEKVRKFMSGKHIPLKKDEYSSTQKTITGNRVYTYNKQNILLSKEFFLRLKDYKDEDNETWEDMIKELLDYWIEGHKQEGF